MPSPAATTCIVVTFHPNEPVGTWLPTLLDQVGHVIVVDNGSCSADLGLETGQMDERIEFIRNDANEGVAKALNQGMRRACELGYDWALTMDQDSRACPNLVSAAARAFEAGGRSRIAAIGARRATQCVPGPTRPLPYRPMVAVITSGSLHSTAAWEELGGFREDFFVDFVDTEFCLRARASGWQILEATEPALEHRIGNPSRKWALGRWMIPSNHHAFRRYYMTRNRIACWRSYAGSDFRWVIRDIRQAVRELVGVTFAEERRGPKLRAMAAGAVDGLLGRSGMRRIPPSPH